MTEAHAEAHPTADVRARRLSPLTPLVRAPLVLVAVVGASWQQLLQREGLGPTLVIALVVFVGGAAYGALSWWRTTYWIDGGELRIDRGVLFRQSRRIRIDRLQGVDIVQPFVARLVGLAELRFDVASGGEREGALAFLPRADAEALRSLLLARRDDLRGVEPAWADPLAAPVRGERELARLDLGRLFGSLLLSAETLWLLVSAVALVTSFGLTGAVAVAGGLVPLTIAFAFTVVRRFTAYYGFVLGESDAGLHVRRGLTALSSQTIAPQRVQGYAVVEPLLWRAVGWARLDVSVAGYKQGDVDQVQASATLMPVARRDEVLTLLSHLLGGHAVDAVALHPAPRRARWRVPLVRRRLALGQDDRLAVSRRGVLTRRTDVVGHARVQSVRLVQGPWQRWLGLADVHLDSPPGPVAVVGRHRDAADARRFAEAGVRHARVARRAGSHRV